jgi:CheY-like chemotaxis protein
MAVQRERVKDKVLVVDDDPAALLATTALLTEEGYEVLSASTIDQALQTVESRKPGVVLFGILRPPAGAIEFARRLALSGSTKFTPVVTVTGLNEYEVGSVLHGVPGIRRIVPSTCAPDALRAEVAGMLRYARR